MATAWDGWVAAVSNPLDGEGGGAVEHAAIVGDDGSIWGASAGFPALLDGEAAALVKGFEDFSEIAPNGMRLGGAKYTFVQGQEGELLRGVRTVDLPAVDETAEGQDGGTAGGAVRQQWMLVCKRFGGGFVAGLFSEEGVAGKKHAASAHVEQVADSLAEAGY